MLHALRECFTKQTKLYPFICATACISCFMVLLHVMVPSFYHRLLFYLQFCCFFPESETPVDMTSGNLTGDLVWRNWLLWSKCLLVWPASSHVNTVYLWDTNSLYSGAGIRCKLSWRRYIFETELVLTVFDETKWQKRIETKLRRTELLALGVLPGYTRIYGDIGNSRISEHLQIFYSHKWVLERTFTAWGYRKLCRDILVFPRTSAAVNCWSDYVLSKIKFSLGKIISATCSHGVLFSYANNVIVTQVVVLFNSNCFH